MDQQQQFLQQFYDVSKGVSKYITLDVLQLGVPYEITRFRFHESSYGRCLVVDLANGFWLVLPKRIGDLASTEERLEWLNTQRFCMIFKGRQEKYRKMAIIEFKTMEQFLLDQATAAIDIPMINFEIENFQNGTTVQDAGAQTKEDEIPQLEAQAQSVQEAKQDNSKDGVITKTGAAPKVTIKVKKERR